MNTVIAQVLLVEGAVAAIVQALRNVNNER